jgi:hypothetical protein
MKTIHLICFTTLFAFGWQTSKAQNAAINRNGSSPDASARLDLNTGNNGTMGLLPEQVALTATNAAGPVTSPATGLIVYNTATAGGAGVTVTPGYYYNAGTSGAPNWVRMGNGWSILGNTGTSSATNFMGTTDAQDVIFKANGTEVMRMGNSKTNLMVNSTSNTTDYLSSTASGTINGIGAYVSTGSANGINAIVSGAATGSAIYAQTSGTQDAAIFKNTGTGAGPTGQAVFIDVTSATNANGMYAISSGSLSTSTIWAENTPTTAGSAYSSSLCNHTIYSPVRTNADYSFGVYGMIGKPGGATPLRTSGVFGYNSIVVCWGALGYNTSIGGAYGGYFSGTATGGGIANPGGGSGTQKTSSSPHFRVGVGSYGDLFGSWTRGEVYGMAVKGERLSLFVDGKAAFTKPILQLVPAEGEKTLVDYSSASLTPDLQASGIVRMENGQATFELAPDFYSQLDHSADVTVVVTPMGPTKGVYAFVEKNKVVILENDKGQASVKLSWMVIAKRNVADSQAPEEVLDPAFNKNLKAFMFDEANTKGKATPLWWDGSKLNTTKVPE